MHQLTEKLRWMYRNTEFQEDDLKKTDKIIREWLEEKILKLGPDDFLGPDSRWKARKVLGFTEKSLEEKFKEICVAMYGKTENVSKRCAQIAKEYYEKE